MTIGGVPPLINKPWFINPGLTLRGMPCIKGDRRCLGWHVLSSTDSTHLHPFSLYLQTQPLTDLQEVLCGLRLMYQTMIKLQFSQTHNLTTTVSRSYMVFPLNDSRWVCLKMRYTPNYSHLIGIMIINHWV